MYSNAGNAPPIISWLKGSKSLSFFTISSYAGMLQAVLVAASISGRME